MFKCADSVVKNSDRKYSDTKTVWVMLGGSSAFAVFLKQESESFFTFSFFHFKLRKGERYFGPHVTFE